MNPRIVAVFMLRVMGVAILAYAVIVVLAWLLQHRLLYQPGTPGRDWAATPSQVGLAFEHVRLPAEDGVRLSAWWVPARRARGVLLFFHGNAGNISHRLESIGLFHRLDLSVLIVDYRGYGRSDGQPSEAGTFRDAAAAWTHLVDTREIPPDRIVIFGRSLGAAVAAHLARTVSPAALILESGFTSAPDAAASAYPFLPARWLTRFSYHTRDYVSGVRCPVLVMHSRNDEIIPFAHGRAIHEAAPQPKRFLALSGGHNTSHLESEKRYRRTLDGFLTDSGGLPRVPGP